MVSTSPAAPKRALPMPSPLTQAAAVTLAVALGMAIGGLIGAVLLIAAILALVAFLAIAWPRIPVPVRLLRIATLFIVIALALVRLVPRA